LKVQEAIVRIFLTSSRSFKRDAASRMPPPLARIYALMPLPKFVWVAELSNEHEFRSGRVLGEILWDATANKYDPFSFIALHYPELLVLNDRDSLSPGPDRLQATAVTGLPAYPVYRNNLCQVP